MSMLIGHITVECPECHSEHSEELHIDHTSYAAYICECEARINFTVTSVSSARNPVATDKYPRLKND
jgi:hypothetical protein